MPALDRPVRVATRSARRTIASTLPAFINDRSAYYQNDWFAKIASDPSYRIPIFNAGTFTDPLFPPVENRRMANRILSAVPELPDPAVLRRLPALRPEQGEGVGRHLRRGPPRLHVRRLPGRRRQRDSAGLVRTGATTRLNRFIDHYAQPPGNPSQPQPAAST